MMTPSPELIGLRLTHYAIWYAASCGYRFGEGAEHDLPRIAAEAAGRISDRISQYDRSKLDEESLHLKAEHDIKVGEVAFSLLIEEMIAARMHVYGPEAAAREGIIGEGTLARAKEILCPFWPIC